MLMSRSATIWDRIKALLGDGPAQGRVLTTKRHTEEWKTKQDHLPREELEHRFPLARQNDE